MTATTVRKKNSMNPEKKTVLESLELSYIQNKNILIGYLLGIEKLNKFVGDIQRIKIELSRIDLSFGTMYIDLMEGDWMKVTIESYPF